MVGIFLCQVTCGGRCLFESDNVVIRCFDTDTVSPSRGEPSTSPSAAPQKHLLVDGLLCAWALAHGGPFASSFRAGYILLG